MAICGFQIDPAHDISKGLSAECLIESKRWLNCPDFLRKTEECWPKRIVVADLSDEHPDVKPEGRVLMASLKNALLRLLNIISPGIALKGELLGF